MPQADFPQPTAAFTPDDDTVLLIHGEGQTGVAESGKITRVHGTSLAWS